MLWNDAKPERIVLRYENTGGGLIVSDDGGRTFALICAAATGVTDLRASSSLMDADGRIWLASFDGLAHVFRASDSTLFVCESYAFGVADLETGKVTRRTSLLEIEKLVECSDRDVRGMCRMQLVDGYCGIPHFPCAPMCDAYQVDLSDLFSAVGSDPSLAACFARRNPGARPDAGADEGDAGAVRSQPDAGGDGTPGMRVEAGCSVTRGAEGYGGWLLLLAAGIGVGVSRKRRGEWG